MFSSKTLKVAGYSMILLALGIGLLTRLIAVFHYVTFDIGPDPDQIRDSFLLMKMWQGEWPTLGPRSSIGGYYTLPLYYYLFFPFTLLGPNPVFHAFPNALFSFLSIPLFMYLTFLLLERVSLDLKLFLCGLAGLWYSLLFGDIFINNFQWNPSSIPFFMMLATAFYERQMRGGLSFLVQTILWGGYGIVLAILISLHSSALFVIPIVFLITASAFIYKAFKKNQLMWIVLPGISILSATIALTPYWIGEFGRKFSNTKLIIKTIISASKDGANTSLLTSIFTKLGHLFTNYFSLLQQAYFWQSDWIYFLISILFLGLTTWIGIVKFRGNGAIWLFWCSTWALFQLAAANIDPPEVFIHYRLLTLFAPIALSMVSIAYFAGSRLQKGLLYSLIGLVFAFSALQNLEYDSRVMLSKFGPDRLVNTGDLIQIMRQLPDGATICDPKIARKRSERNQYNYFNTYIIRRNFTISDTCGTGNFVIHPKRVMLIHNNFLNQSDYRAAYFADFMPPAAVNLFPIFRVVENGKISVKATPFLEMDDAIVYQLN